MHAAEAKDTPRLAKLPNPGRADRAPGRLRRNPPRQESGTVDQPLRRHPRAFVHPATCETEFPMMTPRIAFEVCRPALARLVLFLAFALAFGALSGCGK